MASTIKSDKLSPSTGTALQLGDASDTVTIPTGATLNIVDGLGVAAGGTGLASFTAGDVLYATGTTTLAKLAKGTAEQVLAMNSGATAPDWGSVDLTVLPTITAVKGGTGQTSFTAGDIFYANSTTTITKLGKGTARQGLQTNSGATAPEWTDSPQSLMTAAGDIVYASGANTLAKLAKGSDDEVLTLASGVPSWAEAASGGLSWQSVVTASTLTAVAGNAYPINTTSNECVITLPAGSAGNQIMFTDYAGTWDTNQISLKPNGTEKIKGIDAEYAVTTERGSIQVDYIDGTQGWLPANSSKDTALTGVIEWLLVAGGGGGGYDNSGGGGAGGYRTGTIPHESGITYTVVIGGGGAGSGSGNAAAGVDSTHIGTNVSLTSNGGGAGKWSSGAGTIGGSGGGGSQGHDGYRGNEGGFSPVEGYGGGGSATTQTGGGGGGGSGGPGMVTFLPTGQDAVGNGGRATYNEIATAAGSGKWYAGGGGGGSDQTGTEFGVGGWTGRQTEQAGGGADGGQQTGTAGVGTANTGGGGGGGGQLGTGSAGGSGVCVVRMKDAYYSSSTGSPTVDTSTITDYTILTFNANGTWTSA